jgi:hypothetical protein
MFTGLNYIVRINVDGRLRWQRTGQLVDTSAGHWKDAGNGGGRVPLRGSENPAMEPQMSFGNISNPRGQDFHHNASAATMHYSSRKI